MSLLRARRVRLDRSARVRRLGAWLGSLLIVSAGACDGGGGESVADGLQFDRIAPVPEAIVAPLESYRTRDGSPLPVRHYAASAGKNVVVILLHGSSYHGRYLAPLAARLAETGSASVFTPDLRGHGVSPERRGDVDYVDQLEDDVADLIAFARERHPDAKVVVGGHSSGGGLALRLAGSRHAGLVDGYVLLAPYLGHGSPTTRPDSGWAKPSLPRIIALSILDGFGVRAFQDAITLTFNKPEAIRDGTETLAYSYRLMTGYAPRDYAKDLAAIRAPLLALIGADDEAFLPERLGPTISAHAEGEVAILPGVAHLDIAGSPETAKRIEAWLTAL